MSKQGKHQGLFEMNFKKWFCDIEEVATTTASVAGFMRRVGSPVRRKWPGLTEDPFFKKKKKKKGCKSYGAETPAKGVGGSCQLQEFVSHSYEPLVGDEVINNNPKCKHYGSKGIVIKINILPKDNGKTATYSCTNNGPLWEKGDLLTKTMDQLRPAESTCED